MKSAFVTSSIPDCLAISRSELSTHKLAPGNLQLAKMLLYYRGFVILRGALEAKFVMQLRTEFKTILRTAMKAVVRTAKSKKLPAFMPIGETGAEGSLWQGRWRILPPLRGAFADSQLVANPFVTQVLEDLLGKHYAVRTFASDTCINGSRLQAPHRDSDYYPERKPYAYVVNVPLVTCDLNNGPLEIWPGGSHFWDKRVFAQTGLQPFVQDGRNDSVERFAHHLCSQKVVLRPGDILLRDPGLLHRGTPNRRGKPRTMLTIGCCRADYGHPYGAARLDRAQYQRLDPQVRRRFAWQFASASRKRPAK